MTVPVTPPAQMKSPTLNGRRTTKKTPAAKLASSPPHAMPIAMPTPRRAPRTRRLDTEVAEDGDDQDDVQDDRDDLADVAGDGLVEGRLEAADDQAGDVRDDPSGNEPDDDGAEHFQGEGRDQQDSSLGDVRQVHGRSGLLFCPTSWMGSARAFVSRGAASAGQTLDRVRAVRPLDLGRIEGARRTATVRLTVMVPGEHNERGLDHALPTFERSQRDGGSL